MSAVAGLAAKALPVVGKIAGGIVGGAKKVIGALPIVGGLAKKIVGGIKSIFTKETPQGTQPSAGVQQVQQAGQQMLQGGRDLWGAGGRIVQGFREGGFGGGMGAIQKELPGMQQTVGGMIEAGRQGFGAGREMFGQVMQQGQGAMEDFRRFRRGWQTGSYAGLPTATLR